MFNIFGPILIVLVFVSTILLNVAKFQLFSLAPCCQIKRVTDETSIVETAVWPIPPFSLMCSLLLKDLSFNYYPVSTDLKHS